MTKEHAPSGDSLMFESGRAYYESVLDTVEDPLRTHPDADTELAYEAGVAACIQNQGSWPDQHGE